MVAEENPERLPSKYLQTLNFQLTHSRYCAPIMQLYLERQAYEVVK